MDRLSYSGHADIVLVMVSREAFDVIPETWEM